ncbi:MAG: aminotransferase class III-fold pyridoxal phosphate-dependent enzyme [Pseudomonadota bacterium]
MPTTEDLLRARDRLLGPNVSTFYEEPIHLVKGEGVWLWDADGRQYLDCYNNVPHVGHCHPKVVEAICKQAATLNTHTRYLHEGILRYVEKLTATFAAPLKTAIMTCTGSEANDIALRMAEAVTGKRGVIATDHTYHGNTTAVAQLSMTNRPGTGDASHVRHVPAPDSYRPLGGQQGQAHAQAFAAALERQIEDLEASGIGFSCLIICPFFANEGFPDLHHGFLDPALAVVRKAGGIVIADEVQPGFGRLGSHMWGHERIGLAPDIVTLGKPMANGHPVAAVVTSADIIAAFRQSFRYFNTFGGNPVSCAAAEAVLDVLEEEGLVAQAADVGDYAKAGLRQLATRHACIGDVRGAGLFFGAEMVLDQETKQPATSFTKRIANEMRQEGILMNFLGIHYNTLKIRPSMQFTRAHVDQLIDTLDRVLARTEIHP